jgi:hypothetical protein
MTKDQTALHKTITLEKLAKRVARAVCKFLDVSSFQSCLFRQPGLTSMQDAAGHHCQNPNWRVGSRGITSSNIILIGFIHVSQGSWQPILELDRYIVQGSPQVMYSGD